ncbi:hypothetical protein IEQ34_015654 [Dendrobium chrysotoxum]|uniref:Uncharacterized protein n=1 Tax=Dendrobium chrysotoxum TaxID=161865 RepID=A0AAV7GHB8_DENCH|nr:hypothetical protein IEQ34_015654 [Dendrobium chrysotoxum]
MDGICGLYERKLKEIDPTILSITYDIADLYNFIDGFTDLSALVICIYCYNQNSAEIAPLTETYMKGFKKRMAGFSALDIKERWTDLKKEWQDFRHWTLRSAEWRSLRRGARKEDRTDLPVSLIWMGRIPKTRGISLSSSSHITILFPQPARTMGGRCPQELQAFSLQSVLWKPHPTTAAALSRLSCRHPSSCYSSPSPLALSIAEPTGRTAAYPDATFSRRCQILYLQPLVLSSSLD